MAIWYLDPESGNDANAGTSLATAWKTLSAATTAKGVVDNDTVRIKASNTTIASIGNATWTNNSATVTIPAGLIKDVDMCETAWTAAPNVTSTVNTTNVFQGTNRINLSIGGGFTTGKVAYKALGSTQDFSAYQQLSFFVTSSTTVANCFYLALCSDTTGDVIVNTIAFNTLNAALANRQLTLTIDTGAALGSSIQSVALYASINPGTCTINLDNIIACKAPSASDSLNLRDLIGLNDGTLQGNEWYRIRSISGTTLVLGGQNNWQTSAPQNMPYYGTTGSYNTYRLGGFIELTSQNQLGTLPTRVIISGGWDRTSMSTQVGHTWFGTLTSFTQTINSGTPNINSLFAFNHPTYGNNMVIPLVENIAMYALNVNVQSATGNFPGFGTYKNCIFSSISGGSGVSQGGGSFENCFFNYDVSFIPASTTGQTLEFRNCLIRGITAFSAYPYNGINSQASKFSNCVFLSTVTNTPMASYDNCKFDLTAIQAINKILLGKYDNCTFVNDAGYPFPFNATLNTTYGKFTRYNQDVNKNGMYGKYMVVSTITDANRRTASGVAYKIEGIGNINVPLRYKIATPYIAANTLTTVKAWVKCTNANNSYPIKLRLMAPSQLGVSTPTLGSLAVNPQSGYVQIQVTLTPTQSGVAEFYLEAYSDPDFNQSFSVIQSMGTIYLDDIEVA